jgi:uncharacterized Zn finger protein (UPF0148 family)
LACAQCENPYLLEKENSSGELTCPTCKAFYTNLEEAQKAASEASTAEPETAEPEAAGPEASEPEAAAPE